jgi:hypothetical protein
MQQTPDEPKTLEYSSPRRERATPKLDAPAAAALTVGTLSMVIALFPSGMALQYRVTAGIYGGSLGLLLGIAALTRLLLARRFAASNLAAAASAIACAALALWAGLRAYWG